MVKSPANEGDTDASSIPDLGRSPGGGHSNPLQYSCLENSKYSGAQRAVVHGVAKSQMHAHKTSIDSICVPFVQRLLMSTSSMSMIPLPTLRN